MRNLKTVLLIFLVCTVGFLAFRLETVRKVFLSKVEHPSGLLKHPEESLCTNQIFSAQQPVVLIQGGEETDAPWTSRTPAAKRVRKIFPDPAWMTAKPVLKTGDVITLALFDDAVLSAKISKVTCYPNGAVGITAHLEGNEKGVAYLSYSGGELSAFIEIRGQDDYYIHYDPKTGSQYAIQVDRKNSDIQEGGEPLVPADDIAVAGTPLMAQPSYEPMFLGDIPAGLSSDTVEIDVMIVYTPAACDASGGIDGINNKISLAMQRANEAHSNSDTRVYLNLVHTEETAYTESGNPSNDLRQLTYTGGSYTNMDDVHTWRNTYNADMVCLLESNPGTGGQGWVLRSADGKPAFAFCLARVQQIASTYTVVHEWGHNMGCGHSATQTTQPGPGLYSYSSGWQWNDTKASSPAIGYCTVMTYENFDGSGSNEYRRVAHFSNPGINYIGNSTNATGHVTNGDNAGTIRTVRYALADYRIPLSPVTTLPCSNNFEVSLSNWVPDGGSTPWFRNDGDELNLPTAVSGGYSGTTNAYSGNYFLMFDAAHNENGTAFLESIFDLRGYSDVSIRFHYHMKCDYPPLAGSLILQVATNSAATWTDLWSGTLGTGWREAVQDLTSYAGMTSVQVRIRADIGSNWIYTYIMLDDLVVTGTPSLDIDDDGLPNEWESQYFGGATNANPNATASNGINTVMQTYIAGISPVDPTAFFKISSFETPVVSSNGFVVRWNGTNGRIYSVNWTTNLLNSFQTLTNIIGPQSSYTDTAHSAQGAGFYRIKVQLQ